MKIFLAGNDALKPHIYIREKAPFVLQTFWDIKKCDDDYIKQTISTPKMFFLDSGAFTFMNSGKKVDWESYLTEYINFINKYDIKYFFELDLDTIIGVEKVKKLTNRLERETKKQCIPVFHRCRGIREWRNMCEKYGYVAIGASGITDECKWVKNDKILIQLIDIAHKKNTKVHGLGYTRLTNINDTTIPFDSVDSTSALSGGRFATLYIFKNGELTSQSIKGRSKGYKILNTHNVKEWVKMCNFKDK